ncbi:T9SS type A sorting domain-containing protein [Pedobacter sp. SYP-B3415]|uniref:T9SS type A sorting domain-containing protein n=1 Tax=Pedobacter sp. SYP-B3415 TaxID=2496641 RepID=UPI001F0E8AC1|nr:T9SS type A sorting domain-containing protein [Pedobacter sp. SYP-B3415]
MSRLYKIALRITLPGIFFLVFAMSFGTYAQQDSIRTALRNKGKKAVKAPEIKANITPYKSFTGGNISFGAGSLSSKTQQSPKQDKLLTVIKVSPNPVDAQVNLVYRLEKESIVSVKIMDVLGNEIVTLSNERVSSGEQTKSYTIPSRLNPGIYFLRIVAGNENVVKRISVL